MLSDNLALAHIFIIVFLFFSTQIIKPALTVFKKLLLNQHILIVLQIVRFVIGHRIRQHPHYMPILVFSIIIPARIILFKLKVITRKIKLQIS